MVGASRRLELKQSKAYASNAAYEAYVRRVRSSFHFCDLFSAKSESAPKLTPPRPALLGQLATWVAGSSRSCARSMPVVAILKDRSCEADQHRLSALGVTLAFVDASRIESYAQALSGSQIAISCMASRNVDVDSTDDFWLSIEMQTFASGWRRSALTLNTSFWWQPLKGAIPGD